MMILRFRLFCLPTVCFLVAAAFFGGPAQAQSPPAAAPVLAGPALRTPAGTALVQVNNQILFAVHSSGDQSAQDRADLANLRLAQALRGVLDERFPAAVEATVGQQAGQTVLQLGPKLLLTVTQADSDAVGKPPVLLAQFWADSINRALAQAKRERQPAYLRGAFERAGLLLLVGLLLVFALQLAGRRLGHRPGWPVQTLLWLLIARQIISLFPQARPFYLLLVTGAPRPLILLLAVGLPTSVLVRLWGITLRKLFPPLPDAFSAQDRTERTYQRRVTLARVAEVTGVTILWTTAGLVLAGWLGLNLSALLASAGLIGVAISIVAQDALKDLVAGIYILADDRFGVGDTVQIGAYEGRVERLNLRSTQLRDSMGRLITISNRGIVDVANLTARWAQVDFKIGVSYYTDLAEANRLLLETATALAGDWPERVLAPPELLGVESFTDLNVQLRLTLRTPPGDQWEVGRELRLRVKAAFDAAGIVILNSLYVAPPTTPPPPGPGASA